MVLGTLGLPHSKTRILLLMFIVFRIKSATSLGLQPVRRHHRSSSTISFLSSHVRRRAARSLQHHLQPRPPFVPFFATLSRFATQKMTASTMVGLTNHTDEHSIKDADSKPAHSPVAMARYANDLAACAHRLQQGQLVAFPTETVYGLGAHALDEAACRRIFAAKERPFTDPLIAHVLGIEQALPLWQAGGGDDHDDALEASILHALGVSLWPGPLTLVARASRLVPSIMTAGTGYAAVRAPRHATARQLLLLAGLAVAAPSANKFGHVSPTTAAHVMADLQHEDVWIITDDDASAAAGSCEVGVESTVAKLEKSNDSHLTLTILRQGAFGVKDLEACLRNAGFGTDVVEVRAIKPNTVVADHDATVAPGQLIKHYAPAISTFMLSLVGQRTIAVQASPLDLFQHSVVIDLGERLATLQSRCLAYRDLSPHNDAAAAARCVYDTLRWAEAVPRARCIVVPSLLDNDNETTSDPLLLAVQDRLTRAASGIIVDGLDEQIVQGRQHVCR